MAAIWSAELRLSVPSARILAKIISKERIDAAIARLPEPERDKKVQELFTDLENFLFRLIKARPITGISADKAGYGPILDYLASPLLRGFARTTITGFFGHAAASLAASEVARVRPANQLAVTSSFACKLHESAPGA
jgi:hypothetical protein